MKFDIKGVEELAAKVSALGDGAKDVAESALKAGAGAVADAIRDGTNTLPVRTGVTKKGLQDGLGVSPVMESGGSYNVKVGFEGYNDRGVANAEMARIMESGTSRTPKHPFVRPAVRKAKNRAQQAMSDAADKEIEKIMKG